MPTPHPDGRVGHLLKRVQLALRAELDAALAPLDLTAPQYAALRELAYEPGASNAELARRSFVTPQTMHSILRGLEGAGLIARSPDPEHGRIQRAHLTPEGERRLRDADRRVDAVEARMGAELDDEGRARLVQLLEACLRGLDAAPGERFPSS